LSLQNLLTALDREDLNLVILSKGKTIYSSKEDGIKPLIDAIDAIGTDRLRGSVVIDKIIGKASALLICYIGAKKASAKVMSKMGASVLSRHGIEYFAELITHEIRNRTNTGICPFEKAVLRTSSPRKAYELIKSSIKDSGCR
jgi:hypothetical protein